VDVTSVNDAPILNTILQDGSFNEDTSLLSAFDLDDHFSDVDSVLAYSSSGATNINVVINGDGTVDFSAAGNWNGIEDITFTADDGQYQVSDTIRVMVLSINDAPVLNAIINQGINEDSLFTYSVVASDVDLPSDVLEFSLTTAPSGMTIDSATGSISWTPLNEHVGIHGVTVKVTDSEGAFDTEGFQITVTNVNDPPTLDSLIPDISLDEDDSLINGFDLDDHFSDVDSVLSYSSSGATNVNVVINGDGTVDFSATSNWFGIEDITFTADDTEYQVSDTIRVRILPVNDAPVLNAINNVGSNEDAFFTYTAIASDVDLPSDVLIFSLTTAPSGMTIDSATGTISWTPLNEHVGAHDVTVKVTDSGGAFDTEGFQITVANVNDPPILETLLPDISFDEDGSLIGAFNLDDHFSDVDSGLSYSFAGATNINPVINGDGTVDFSVNADWFGIEHITFTADDSQYQVTDTVRVRILPANDAPILTAIINQGSIEDALFTYTAIASDVDIPNDVLTYSLTTAPSGMMIDSATGFISWTPTNDDVGTHNVTVKVTDSSGAYDTEAFDISVVNMNDPPAIISTAITTAEEGTQYTYDVDAVDIDVGDTLTFSLLTFPTGMVIDANIGEITWTPIDSQVGANPVIVEVSDGNGGRDTQSFVILVVNRNNPPILTAIIDQVATEDLLFTYDVIASDDDLPGDVLTFSLTTAPLGMTIDSATGVISWQPENTDVGVHDVTVKVSDSGGAFDTKDFDITVGNVNDPPTLDVFLPDRSFNEDGTL
jgi:hypothetical protein